MARFYGQTEGRAQTNATRVGDRYIRTSAQSWDGSVITRLNYSDDGLLMVQINIANSSSTYDGDGNPYFYGTLDDLRECFRDWKEQEVIKK